MGRTILIPIDANENCKHALKFYTDNLFNKEDTIIFLHNIEPTSKKKLEEDDDGELWDRSVPNPSAQRALDNGKALTHKYLAWGRDAGVNVKALVQSEPKSGVAIVNVAKEHDADHIIVVKRGLNALGRTLMGSVSNYVVNHAKVTVTVVPVPDANKSVRGLRRLSMY